MNDKICLVIIYNHRFEKNIQKLNTYYANKFSHIFHVIPFYTSDNPQVITVYENSHQFSGYIAQAYKTFYNTNFSHYVFVGDDLLLNPNITADTILNQLNLSVDSGYIKNIYNFHTLKQLWHVPDTLYKFTSTKGVNYTAEIPTYTEALAKAAKHQIQIAPLNSNYLFGLFKASGKTFFKNWVYTLGYVLYKRFKKINILPYPLVGAYSDFVVVPKCSIEKFSKYCGVFAAMNIFAEVAIPTALMLSCDKIEMEKEEFKGKEVWTQMELEKYSKACNNSVRQLFVKHPQYIYFHPAKLSVWSID